VQRYVIELLDEKGPFLRDEYLEEHRHVPGSEYLEVDERRKRVIVYPHTPLGAILHHISFNTGGTPVVLFRKDDLGIFKQWEQLVPQVESEEQPTPNALATSVPFPLTVPLGVILVGVLLKAPLVCAGGLGAVVVSAVWTSVHLEKAPQLRDLLRCDRFFMLALFTFRAYDRIKCFHDRYQVRIDTGTQCVLVNDGKPVKPFSQFDSLAKFLYVEAKVAASRFFRKQLRILRRAVV
jgi:hypothetical protein